MAGQTIVISANAAWNIVNFRIALIQAMKQRGYHVMALAPSDSSRKRFAELDIEYRPIVMDKKGISPIGDLLLLGRYYRAFRRIRPAVFLGYTAKPNIYGSLAAGALGIPSINNVSGLGTAFIKTGLLTRVVTFLYRLAFRRSATVFFQNAEDMALFADQHIVRRDQARLLPGSGIDLERFHPGIAAGDRRGDIHFLFVGRLLRDKGIEEFVEAARRVRAEWPRARFQVLGFLDAENRTAVSRAEVEAWVAEGTIEYLGEAEDVRPFLAAADCVVLPSYREGLPRVLLEGAAMGKPLIATDVPGCRHVVEEGQNGFLCKVRDSGSLADAMLRMLRLPMEERARLGAEARRRVEAEYDERIVIEHYVDAIEHAVGGRR